jgi:hypothetical protein
VAGRGCNHYPTKAVRLTAETRRYQMLELTKAGATERQIAETLGVSKGLVHKDVKAVLESLAKTHSRTADSVRALEMERYLSLLSRWWQQAMAGDEAATHMVLKIMQRIDVINGIIPDRPMIDMRTQTIQLGEGMGLMELARAIANGNGDNGVDGIGPEDNGQSGSISNGSAGSETLPEAD